MIKSYDFGTLFYVLLHLLAVPATVNSQQSDVVTVRDPILRLPFVLIKPTTNDIQPFFIAQQELSQAKFEEIMGFNPSKNQPGGANFDPEVGEVYSKDYPVDTVAVRTAQEYCARLNAIARAKRLPFRYQLPTTEQMFVAMGDGDPTQLFVTTADDLSRYVRYDRSQGNASLNPKSVVALGRRYRVNGRQRSDVDPSPNYGLHHILGNVAEWCYDPKAEFNKQARIAGGHTKLKGEFFFSDNRDEQDAGKPWNVVRPDFALGVEGSYPNPDHQVGFRLTVKQDLSDDLIRMRVEHSIKVTDIPSGSERVEIWFWLPQETQDQRVLDLTVLEGPNKTRVVKDEAGNRYLAAVMDNPRADRDIVVRTEYKLERVLLDTKLPLDGSIPELDQVRKNIVFSEYLDLSPASGFHITQSVLDQCDSNGIPDGSDPVATMQAIFRWVVSNTTHYGSKKNSSGKIASSVADNSTLTQFNPDTGAVEEVGENAYVHASKAGNPEVCLAQKGGGCTDQHSLVVAWARYRGIPARLLFGQRLTASEGDSAKAGYRCIVEYFIPDYGWIPMDCSQAGNSAADFEPGSPEWESAVNKYFSELADIRRVSFYRGRNLPLVTYDGELTEPLNLFIQGYVRVDGRPHQAFHVETKYVKVRGTDRWDD